MSSLLKGQFITWPWDMTQKENRLKLFEWMDMLNVRDMRRTLEKYASFICLFCIIFPDASKIFGFLVFLIVCAPLVLLPARPSALFKISSAFHYIKEVRTVTVS